MTDNSERGITINTALAWTMLVSVVGLIWWGGRTLASMQSAADRLTAALSETRDMIMGSVPVRRSWRPASACWKTVQPGRKYVRFDALSLSINELKQQARETNTLLRELSQRP